MTNLEWLKTLDVDRMASVLDGNCAFCACGQCAYAEHKDNCIPEDGCRRGVKLWLEQEHKEELKPCPFCGSKSIYIDSKDGYADKTTVIFCNECKSTVFIEDNEEEGYDDKTVARAIEAWNRRKGNGN